ncbi:MAG TPA: hypothetical protein VNQ73_12470, partial [Ilumatobacter sp.]|nr:hypothetical protein [Ilumatobacter sp.]
MRTSSTRVAVGVAALALVAGTVSITQAVASGDGASASAFVPVAPTRVLDTRIDVGLPGRFVHRQGRHLVLTGKVAVVMSGNVA